MKFELPNFELSIAGASEIEVPGWSLFPDPVSVHILLIHMHFTSDSTQTLRFKLVQSIRV
jgi:hypothetical protein